MMKIVAAIGNDAAAHPVLEVTLAVAGFFGDEAEAVHFTASDDARTAKAAAQAVGVPLHLQAGETVAGIVSMLSPNDVRLGVIGARSAISGARPAGSTVLAVAEASPKPLMVVPPDVRTDTWEGVAKVLVPLDGTLASARAIEQGVHAFAGSGADVVALHVFDASTVPRFWDRPLHEPAVWAEEFLARYCAESGTRLELRSGSPGEQVLDVAKSERVDIIVLAWAQDLSGLRAQVIRQVLAHSRVPVLLLPVAPEDDQTRPAFPAAQRAEQK